MSEEWGKPADSWVPTDVDLARPNAARVYDYFLGGAHNFDVDREFAGKIAEMMPEATTLAMRNRRFLQRAVRELCGLGIRQFLDLGSGIPTVGNVHEIAQAIDPAARVVYVDNEAVAVAHSQLLLEDNPNATVVAADITDPGRVLAHPNTRELLDFDQPIAVILCAVLHFVPDEGDPKGLIARYWDAVCAGSYLALSHGTMDNREDIQTVGDQYKNTANPVTLRSRAEVAALLDGIELIEPGLIFTPLWRPEELDQVGTEEAKRSGVYAAVGRKS
ncbi:S-adenosyl methyltransferase [Tamaricihabitans halophyticus]|uniref:S-adenosyl methyltransferase n=1 Tax=Tamaricihabitans halophyticus TaxID=1262583 RepID=A0A4R2R6D3_9PSEU|nr:SAM-dependent methyltransferase [Tamaricihabitans halophyticus]TCP54905.1 S-adenosyl methyltransferase [Tamaricihabitans halophyticus]